jgi:catalase-peroxidase
MNQNPKTDGDTSARNTDPAPEPARGQSDGRGLRLRRRVPKLDLAALKKDIATMLTTSQDWWPADYGNYGPLFIRLAWHSAGTYRTSPTAAAVRRRHDPLRAAQQLARQRQPRQGARLLWPIKQKYGNRISWADLMVLTGNVALESMGFKTFGFAGGREDVWEPQESTCSGAREPVARRQALHGRAPARQPARRLADGPDLRQPEGPNGNPDPLLAAHDIRTTFGAWR